MYNALDVAKYVINYCNEKQQPISNLKLQKLLYFLWVDFYKQRKCSLFHDNICAWQLGPVVPDVYYEFCSYAGLPIARKYCVANIEENDKTIIEKIIDNYINLSAFKLVEKTHESNTPWAKVYNNGTGARNIIPADLILKLECANC